MDDIPQIEELRREIAILAKRLTKSEQYRARTEELKDKLQVLLKTISAEIADSREEIAGQKNELESLYLKLAQEKEESDRVLFDLLPRKLVEEIKATGKVKPKRVPEAAILFADFASFSKIASEIDPEALLDHLDECFSGFDLIAERLGLSKIKTIGDSYMCAGGLFGRERHASIRSALAGLEMLGFMRDLKGHRERKGRFSWDVRLGLHCGPVVMGAIGRKGLFFDVWGDTVNVAARMVQTAPTGTLNISEQAEAELSEYFVTSPRGEVETKNRGLLKMFLVEGLRPDFAEDSEHRTPNHRMRQVLKM